MRELRGFTLSEMLCTLGIVSIMTLVAAPGLLGTTQEGTASAAATHLHRALQHARTEARRQSRQLQVCGSNDGKQCSKNWDALLLLFTDKDGDSEADTEEILHRYTIEGSPVEIQTRLGFGKKVVTFDQLGRANLTGSFLICGADGAATPLRKITWNKIGRPYVLRTAEKVAQHSGMSCL